MFADYICVFMARRFTEYIFEKTISNNKDLAERYERVAGKKIKDVYFEVVDYLNTVFPRPGEPSRPLLLVRALKRYIEAGGQRSVIQYLLEERDAPRKAQKSRGRRRNPSNLINLYIEDLRNCLDSCPVSDPMHSFYVSALRVVRSLAGSRSCARNISDIISEIDEALANALRKYDPERVELSRKLRRSIEKGDPQTIGEYEKIIFENLRYGDLAEVLRGQWESEFSQKDQRVSREDIKKWLLERIPRANLGSVIGIWTRAAVTKTLRSNGIIKAPMNGAQPTILYLDESDPLDESGKRSVLDKLGEQIATQPEIVTESDSYENILEFQARLNELFEGLDAQSRLVVLRRFGIGLQRPLSAAEIAEQDGITSARTNQLLNNALSWMTQNAQKKGISSTELRALLENQE